MKKKLSESVQVGASAELLERMSRSELKLEYRKAKTQERRFIQALEDRGVPTRVTTPRDADKAERLRYRRARQMKGSRSLYRHLVSWRRYIRTVNALIKATSVPMADVVAAAAKRREEREEELKRRAAGRVLKRRRLRMAEFKKLRSNVAQYALAVKYFSLYRTARRVDERDPYAQAFFLVKLLELRAKLPAGTYRVSKHTMASLQYAQSVLRQAEREDPYLRKDPANK